MIEERRYEGQRADLELVRSEASRAGQIVRSLLAFVRRSSPDRSPADLNQIARAAAQLREHHLGQRRITLQLDLHPEPLPVAVNRDEIHQTVVNLLVNAEHALADRQGTITIRTKGAGATSTLQVVDDGPGISAELRGRVFEPFFTTKDVGQGTGLGLSIALGIARAHGGSLDLCPTPKGACFQLSLPARPAAATASASRSTFPPSSRCAAIPRRSARCCSIC